MAPVARGDIGWKQKTQSKQSILMFPVFTLQPKVYLTEPLQNLSWLSLCVWSPTQSVFIPSLLLSVAYVWSCHGSADFIKKNNMKVSHFGNEINRREIQIAQDERES